MGEHIESMPVLPIGQMLKDADVAMEDVENGTVIATVPAEFLGDLACHIRALVAELQKASAACALAHQHLDTYGVASGDHTEREVASQEAVFEVTGPFCRAVGHGFAPLYPED